MEDTKMSTSLKSSSLDELFHILDCKKLKDLSPTYNHVTNKDLIKLANELNPILLNRRKLLQSISATLTDSSVYPVLLLWNITGLITLNPLTWGIVTGLFFLFLLRAAKIQFSATYYELAKEEKKTLQSLQMMSLKQAVADEILAQLNPSFSIKNLPLSELKKTEKQTVLLPQKRDSLNLGMLVGTTLFSTYFIGINAILTALGLTVIAAFLSTPIGLIIGGSIAVGASLIFGYQQYRDDKQTEIARKKQNKLTKHVNVKIQECYRLQKICKKQQLISETQSVQPLSKSVNEHNNDSVLTHANYKIYKNPMIFVNRKKQKHNHHSEIYTAKFGMSV